MLALVALTCLAISALILAALALRRLRAQIRTLEGVARLLLTGHDADLELGAWVKVLWSYGNPPEREGGLMSASELAVVKRLTDEAAA